MFDTSPAGLSALISRGASSRVIFARDLSVLNSLDGSFTKMASSLGGIVLLGVNPNGKVDGLSPEDRSAAPDKLKRILSAVLDPTRWIVDEASLHGKVIVFAQVLDEQDDLRVVQQGIIRRRLKDFVIQLTSVIAFYVAVWIIVGPIPSSRNLSLGLLQLIFPPLTNMNFVAVPVAFIAFFTLIFYGTSNEVTPFAIFNIIPAFRKLISPRTSSTRIKTHAAATPNPQSNKPDKDAESASKRPSKMTELNSSLLQSESITSLTTPSVEVLIDELKDRAAYFASKLERKTNTYMVVGVFIGFLGLGIWAWKFSAPPDSKQSNLTIAHELLFRLTILVFVELLAGFFLRQYRIGTEDFKQFFELEHRARWKAVGYAVLKANEQKDPMREFALKLGEVNIGGKLLRGESTNSIEAMKAEQNIALEAVKIISDAAKQVATKAKEK